MRLIIRPLETEAMPMMWRGWGPIRNATSDVPTAANGPVVASVVLTNGLFAGFAEPDDEKWPTPDGSTVTA